MARLTREERQRFNSVRKQVAGLSDESLACRDGNHSFTVPLDAGKNGAVGWRRVKCRNDCGCVRYQELDSYGLILKSQIKYPRQGYLLHNTGRLTGVAKGAARIESWERQMKALGR